MSLSQMLDKIPVIAVYILLIGNVVIIGQFMFRVVGQTGGFLSSHAEMRRMGEQVDKEAMSKLYCKYKKRMATLWIGAIGVIVLSLILNALIR